MMTAGCQLKNKKYKITCQRVCVYVCVRRKEVGKHTHAKKQHRVFIACICRSEAILLNLGYTLHSF